MENLRNGIPIIQTCRDLAPNFPRASTIYSYANATVERAKIYAAAREDYSHAVVEQTVIIADTMIDPSRARNMIGARQWAASRINSKAYGEKLDMNVNNAIDINVAIQAARKRANIIDNPQQSTFLTPDIKSVEIILDDDDIDPFS